MVLERPYNLPKELVFWNYLSSQMLVWDPIFKRRFLKNSLPKVEVIWETRNYNHLSEKMGLIFTFAPKKFCEHNGQIRLKIRIFTDTWKFEIGGKVSGSRDEK